MKEKKIDPFAGLTWSDIDDWAGDRVASRGRSYQKNGYVSDLAVTADGDLVAWVNGTHRYATMVSMNEESGLPDSVCSCPYSIDCKHGVAVVLEYLKCVEENIAVPEALENDQRLELAGVVACHDEYDDDEDDEDEFDDDSMAEDTRMEITSFLKKKTKDKLVGLFLDLAERYPEVRQDIADRKQLASGNTSGMVKQLRKEIRGIGPVDGYHDRWEDDLPSPDLSRVRKKLAELLAAGHADEVLSLGRELLAAGTTLLETYDDDGEAGMEVAECYPVIVRALEVSSLSPADRLEWAVNAVLDDDYGMCDVFCDYLQQEHEETAWNLLTDRLLKRLSALPLGGEISDRRDYRREQLSNMVIRSLENSGRISGIIPFCRSEAELSGSYQRLVNILIEDQQYSEAEKWIVKGILDIGRKWPGIQKALRESLLKIRTLQKNWPGAAAIRTDSFVGHPTEKAYAECRESSLRAGIWPQVREHLIAYLETGAVPREQKNWPLPGTALPESNSSKGSDHPMIHELIEVAIFEKDPEKVLYWYDRLPEKRYIRRGLFEDRVADAVADHAPERAVAIWKKLADREIAQVKPKAYREAARYLRRAERVMAKQKKSADWEQYLQELRRIHARKSRLIEILNSLENGSIIKRKR